MIFIFRFQKNYFLLMLLLFVTEIVIALYVHDTIIRPYIGDLLVVILLYCAVRGLVSVSIIKTAIFVLLFAYVVEISQYYHLIDYLGWSGSALARTVMGIGFSWIDMVAYTGGIVIVLFVERIFARRTKNERAAVA
ncbi:DUF2809 domain-containing protein [Olivibacter sitiensis]|uniref:ribosomal maturation YjgA family protein n=1 Tax=Olivibacter sitiensis TaxID=376470 RepID=UPI0004160737|nr:DUF2809 domain-containing protein [Olivibacter sitiensis]